MGLLAIPIRLQHAPSFSADGTLVNMSDPFSYVWIFFKAKSIYFYPLAEPMISSLDVLGPEVVGCVLRKVDGPLTVAIESEFLLSDP